MRKIDDEWRNWVAVNIARGCDKNGIFEILLKEGFDYLDIIQVMEAESGDTIPSAQPPAPPQEEHLRFHPFLPLSEQLDDDRAELYTVDDFLNSDECDRLAAHIGSKLVPSGLTLPEADTAYRTSRTCTLAELDDDFIRDIDQRICQYLGIASEYSEAIQGQYYRVGEEFKPHTDYFEANDATPLNEQGQRTYTFMIYLNDTEDGGDTDFPRLGVRYKPRKGTAVIWNSLDTAGRPNFNTLHHGMPVKKGYKAIITKWFRTQARAGSSADIPYSIKEKNELVPLFTLEGFKKSRLPEALFNKIRAFYHESANNVEEEHVPGDFVYKAGEQQRPGSALVDLPSELREEIHDQLKPMMEEWCEEKLEPTFVYGIRVYQDQAVLRRHRDRIDTHIISAILNVDQDVDQEWPLVIDDHYYRQHHVYLKPGELVFYEGGRLRHGRPIPLDGRRFANIFAHFKPVDYQAPD